MARLLRVIVALLLLSGCAAGGGNVGGSEPPAAETGGAESGGAAAAGPVVVGSADFPEQLILGNIYALALENAGIEVERQFNIGSREVYFQALQNGEVDVFAEYLGSTYGFLTEQQGEVLTEVEDLRAAVTEALPEGLVLLESSAAQDQDALAVTQATADQYGLTTVSDLAPVAGELTAGGPAEEETRRVGLTGLQEVYGITFGEFVVTDAGGPVTVEALKSGRIDVGRVFTTSGFLETEGFVVLQEDKPLIPGENVTPIVREEVQTPELEEALNAVSAALTTESLTGLNKRVEIDQEDPEDVARDFLTQEGLISG